MAYMHYISAHKPTQEVKEALDWAKEHCPSYITNLAKERDGDWFYEFIFGDRKDCVWFMLRWS